MRTPIQYFPAKKYSWDEALFWDVGPQFNTGIHIETLQVVGPGHQSLLAQTSYFSEKEST